MVATWILCIFIVLIVPVLVAQVGFLRMRGCKSMDAPRGYRSTLSLSSAEAWAFAQKASSGRYIITGLVMAVLSLLLILAVPSDVVLNLFIFTGTILLFQAAAVIVLISTVESQLRARYGEKKEA